MYAMSDAHVSSKLASIMVYKTNFADTCASDIAYTQTGYIYNDI